MRVHIDHIDPTWAEGRDYMTVCGLDTAANMCERDRALNISKSNRFVPWRWCRDELGDIPVEPGDLCLFLKHGTNEWVLEEFLGTWWFEQSLLWGYALNQPTSAQTREKIGEGNLLAWARLDEQERLERCKKMNEGRKGKGTANDWERTEEYREKVAEGTRRVWASLDGQKRRERGKKISEALKGRQTTEETREKIAEGVRRSAARRKGKEKLRRMSVNDPLAPDFD